MTDPAAPLRDLAGLGADVPWPDPDAERAAREHTLPLDPGRPRTPYGRLATTAGWLAGVQGRFPPRPPADPRLVVVTARHTGAPGARSLDDDAAAAAALADRTLPALRLADVAGIRVEVVDAGEVGDITVEDAGLTTQIVDGVDAGARLADRMVDEGADLLVLTEVSPGASTAAAAVIAVLTNAEPVLVSGRGSGLDDAGWAVKTAAIRDARRRGEQVRLETEALVAAVGGRDLALLAGLLLGASVRRTPVLVDGVSAVAASLVARDVAARITRWFRLASAGTDLAEQYAVTRMGLAPLADLGLSGVGVTAGVGGVLAVEHVRTAARLADGPLSLGRPASADVGGHEGRGDDGDGQAPAADLDGGGSAVLEPRGGVEQGERDAGAEGR